MDKTKNFIKAKSKIIIAIIGIILVIAVSALGFITYKNTNEIKSLKSELSQTKSDLGQTQENLTKTTDEKVALEGQNKTLNEQIAQMTSKQTELEAQVVAKQAEVAAKQKDLDAVNASLASAKRCVAKFDSIKGLIAQYDSNVTKSVQSVFDAIEATLSGNEALANQKLADAERYANAATSALNSINGTLNQIKTGKC
jgi:chromosome segregation ATPase